MAIPIEFNISISNLLPFLALITSIAGSAINREENFDKKVKELRQKFLSKKVSALKLLFDSIEFTAEELSEVKEFKGREFFIEVDRYSDLDKKILSDSRIHRMIISVFHYGIAAMLVFILLSFIKFNYLNIIISVISLLLFCFLVAGFIVLRKKENNVSIQMEELKD